MRRASWGRHLGSAIVLLFALDVASAAWAADPAPAASASAAPAATASAAAPAASAAAGGRAHARGLFHGHARRPIFLGLLAAAFLIIGALAGANDRPGGDPPKTT
jgi:hypothetical protein